MYEDTQYTLEVRLPQTRQIIETALLYNALRKDKELLYLLLDETLSTLLLINSERFRLFSIIQSIIIDSKFPHYYVSHSR